MKYFALTFFALGVLIWPTTGLAFEIDLGGDGVKEILEAAGPDELPTVKVKRQDGSLIGSFEAYDKGMRDGVRVAACDLTGDGRPEIVTGAQFGAGPQVRVFDSYGKWTGQQFMAYSETFTGGIFIACGDGNDDGVNDIITGAGPSGGPHVRVFGPDGGLLKEWFTGEQTDTRGVQVNIVDGKLVTTPGPSTPGTGTAIVVDRSRQLLTYSVDGVPLKRFSVSTGRRFFETPLGQTTVTKKIPLKDYYWPGAYLLKDVYWNLQFRQQLYIHTAYWHNNFGTPMSSGCINMRESEAKWLYERIEVGTPVTVTQ